MFGKIRYSFEKDVGNPVKAQLRLRFLVYKITVSVSFCERTYLNFDKEAGLNVLFFS